MEKIVRGCGGLSVGCSFRIRDEAVVIPAFEMGRAGQLPGSI
jgi:hypothetical protein